MTIRFPPFSRSRAALLAALLLASVSSTPARAQAHDVKMFDPVPGPHAILGVHTSRPLTHLALWAGLTTSYANDLLIGQRDDQTFSRPVAHRVAGELAVSLGLFGWVEAGLSLPVYLRQLGENYDADGFETARSGVGDLRLLVKGRLLRNDRFRGFGLALVLELGVPTGTPDAFMQSGVVFTPRAVLDYRHPKGYVVALNLGARIRGRTAVGDLALGSELRLGLGAEAPLGVRGLSVLAELVAAIGLARPAVPDTSTVSSRSSPVEALAALRWRHASGLTVTGGAGVGLTDGYGAPDLRALLTIGYTFRLKPGKRTTPRPTTGSWRTGDLHRPVA